LASLCSGYFRGHKNGIINMHILIMTQALYAHMNNKIKKEKWYAHSVYMKCYPAVQKYEKNL
jgi:hypothetical protein